MFRVAGRAHRARDLVAVQHRQPDVEERRRPGGSAAATGRAPRGRRARGHGLPGQLRAAAQSDSAASRLSSTTRTRGAAAHASGRQARELPLDVRGRAREAARRTRCPAAARRSSAATRAAVQLHQLPHQREADAEPALRALERSIGLHEHVEDARQQVGEMPMPRSRTRHDRRRRSRAGDDRDRAARLGVLRGVVQQVGEHLREPRAVGVEPDRLGRQLDARARGPRRRSADGSSRSRRASTLASSTRLRAAARACRV